MSTLVEEVLVQLLFQHAEIRRLFGADERLELLEGNLVVVVGGGDLLGQRVVVGGLLQVLAEGGHENVRPVFAEHRCEGVGPVDKPVERQSRMSGPYSHSNVSDEGYVSGPSQRSPTRSSMKSNAMSMTPKGGSWYATSSVSVRRTTGG